MIMNHWHQIVLIQCHRIIRLHDATQSPHAPSCSDPGKGHLTSSVNESNANIYHDNLDACNYGDRLHATPSAQQNLRRISTHVNSSNVQDGNIHSYVYGGSLHTTPSSAQTFEEIGTHGVSETEKMNWAHARCVPRMINVFVPNREAFLHRD